MNKQTGVKMTEEALLEEVGISMEIPLQKLFDECLSFISVTDFE